MACGPIAGGESHLHQQVYQPLAIVQHSLQPVLVVHMPQGRTLELTCRSNRVAQKPNLQHRCIAPWPSVGRYLFWSRNDADAAAEFRLDVHEACFPIWRDPVRAD